MRIDGTDLRDVQLRSIRRQLGVVLQDPFLFSGTIADNIRFGRPEATDEEVAAAAHAIGVDRITARFDGGLDHVVREGGSGLSAGERQLISIARALLADPRILILDEATSNIDRPSEILIEQAFDTLLEGRTSVIIAHRLATVRRADEILVVEKGRITQRGTEAELLAEDGPFRRLSQTLHGTPLQRRRLGTRVLRRVASSGSMQRPDRLRAGVRRSPGARATRPSRSRANGPRGRRRGRPLGDRRLGGVLARPGQRQGVQFDGGLAVECLLDPSLLLRLEQRMILERILDLIVVERHVAVELRVLLLQLEMILDDACKR